MLDHSEEVEVGGKLEVSCLRLNDVDSLFWGFGHAKIDHLVEAACAEKGTV